MKDFSDSELSAILADILELDVNETPNNETLFYTETELDIMDYFVEIAVSMCEKQGAIIH